MPSLACTVYKDNTHGPGFKPGVDETRQIQGVWTEILDQILTSYLTVSESTLRSAERETPVA